MRRQQQRPARHPAAYNVSTVNRDGTRSHGSGIAIDDHHILTCAHVLSDGGRTYVGDGKNPTFWVTAEQWDRDSDVAVLHTDRVLPEYVPVPEEDVPAEVEAVSHGIRGGQQVARFRQGSSNALFGRPSWSGDSGGGIVANYRGPQFTVGVIWGSEGGRTYSAPFRAIKRLLSLSRCGKRRPPTPPAPVTPPTTPAAAPLDVSVSAETLPHTEPATVRWIPNGPNAARMHFGIPRGVPGERGPAGADGNPGQGTVGERGPQGPPADPSRIIALESEVAALRKRLDKMSRRVEIPIEVSPERGQ